LSILRNSGAIRSPFSGRLATAPGKHPQPLEQASIPFGFCYRQFFSIL
jgi:hypothetical protein